MEDMKKLVTASEVVDTLKHEMDRIAKAAETVSTNTFSPATRSIFSPENLDEEIKILVPGIKGAVMRQRLPRMPGKGQATAWKKLTSALHTNVGTDAGGAGTDTSIAFADAGAPNETTQTYSTVTEAYKLLGRKLEVGGLYLAASRQRDGQPDVMTDRERHAKMTEVILGEEEMIITGNATTRTLEFNGLQTQITTNSGNLTFLTASGINVYNEALFQAGAVPTLLIAHPRQMRALSDSLESTGSIQRIVSQNGAAETVGGTGHVSKLVNATAGTLIDVRAHRYVGNNAFLLTERSPAAESWIEMEDLIPMSRIDVPSSNLSFISFIYEATVLKVIGEPFQYKLTGLATT